MGSVYFDALGMTMLRKLAAAALLLGSPLVAAPAAQAAAPAGCFDRSAPSTYEESRIDTPALPGGVQVPSALVEAGGFTSSVERLRAQLCRARSVAAAHRLLKHRGEQLDGRGGSRARPPVAGHDRAV